MFASPVEERYFEDYIAGSVHELGTVMVEEAEVIDFCPSFRPQPMHIDPEAAKQSIYGGLIASGWHTVSLMMRLYTTKYLAPVSSLGSPGVDELRWLKPVRPGDELSVRVTITETRRSQSKPDRGIVRSFAEITNQKGELVMSMKGVNFMLCRDARKHRKTPLKYNTNFLSRTAQRDEYHEYFYDIYRKIRVILSFVIFVIKSVGWLEKLSGWSIKNLMFYAILFHPVHHYFYTNAWASGYGYGRVFDI